MKDLLMFFANVMISVYVPFEIGRMLVEGVTRREQSTAEGKGEADSVMNTVTGRKVVCGGKFLAVMRKDLCGLACVLFAAGMLTGSTVGYGGMVLLWFIELMMLGAWVDWHCRASRRTDSVFDVSMNKRRGLREMVRQGAKKNGMQRHKRTMAH